MFCLLILPQLQPHNYFIKCQKILRAQHLFIDKKSRLRPLGFEPQLIYTKINEFQRKSLSFLVTLSVTSSQLNTKFPGFSFLLKVFKVEEEDHLCNFFHLREGWTPTKLDNSESAPRTFTYDIWGQSLIPKKACILLSITVILGSIFGVLLMSY